MARSATTATTGNSIALKLTDEVHQTLVNVVATTGRISAAAGKCGLGISTVRGWLIRGRAEAEGPFHDLAEAIERAKADFVVTAARRLNQLAIGGSIMLPAFDKQNNPIRDEHGQLIVTEKIVMPNPQALMYLLDRVDPQPRAPEPEAPHSGAPELTDAEQAAEAARHYDLFAEVFRTMRELGYPGLDRLLDNVRAETVIETSAVQVPQPAAERAPAKEAASPLTTPKEDVAAPDVSNPETPAEPEPRRPKFEDAF